MISVLHFSNTLVRGGAEQHMLTLLRGLDRSRFRPHLVCTPEVAEKIGPDLPSDVELLPLRLRKPSDVGAARALGQLLRARTSCTRTSSMGASSHRLSASSAACRWWSRRLTCVSAGAMV